MTHIVLTQHQSELLEQDLASLEYEEDEDEILLDIIFERSANERKKHMHE